MLHLNRSITFPSSEISHISCAQKKNKRRRRKKSCWSELLPKLYFSLFYRVSTGTTGKATSSPFPLWRWKWGRSISAASAARGGGLPLYRWIATIQPRVMDKWSSDVEFLLFACLTDRSSRLGCDRGRATLVRLKEEAEYDKNLLIFY